jgi:hypothetical protein
MTTKRKNRTYKPAPMYLVVNGNDEVYSGMKYGFLTWSFDWNEGKPLHKENTNKLMNIYPNTQLLEL